MIFFLPPIIQPHRIQVAYDGVKNLLPERTDLMPFNIGTHFGGQSSIRDFAAVLASVEKPDERNPQPFVIGMYFRIRSSDNGNTLRFLSCLDC